MLNENCLPALIQLLRSPVRDYKPLCTVVEVPVRGGILLEKGVW